MHLTGEEQLGILFGLGFVGVFAFVTWRAIKNRDARAKTGAEFKEKPLNFLFTLVWGGSVLVFILGIIVGALGWEPEFFDTGLKVWHVAGLTAVVGLIISMNV